MQVHADYGLLLASLGASRDEIKETAARRSAEARRRLIVASGVLREVTETEDGVTAVASRLGLPPPKEPLGEPEGREFGRLLSVRA